MAAMVYSLGIESNTLEQSRLLPIAVELIPSSDQMPKNTPSVLLRIALLLGVLLAPLHQALERFCCHVCCR